MLFFRHQGRCWIDHQVQLAAVQHQPICLRRDLGRSIRQTLQVGILTSQICILHLLQEPESGVTVLQLCRGRSQTSQIWANPPGRFLHHSSFQLISPHHHISSRRHCLVKQRRECLHLVIACCQCSRAKPVAVHMVGIIMLQQVSGKLSHRMMPR